MRVVLVPLSRLRACDWKTREGGWRVVSGMPMFSRRSVHWPSRRRSRRRPPLSHFRVKGDVFNRPENVFGMAPTIELIDTGVTSAVAIFH